MTTCSVPVYIILANSAPVTGEGDYNTPALGVGSINENENETIFIITLPKMIPMT